MWMDKRYPFKMWNQFSRLLFVLTQTHRRMNGIAKTYQWKMKKVFTATCREEETQLKKVLQQTMDSEFRVKEEKVLTENHPQKAAAIV